MSSQLGATGLAEDLAGAIAGARGLLSNFLDLFSLEARRAGLALALMLACAATGAILVVAAWLGLMAALALHAVALGISWAAAVATVALGNLAAAAGLLWLCRRISRSLLFPATRRQLRSTRIERN